MHILAPSLPLYKKWYLPYDFVNDFVNENLKQLDPLPPIFIRQDNRPCRQDPALLIASLTQ